LNEGRHLKIGERGHESIDRGCDLRGEACRNRLLGSAGNQEREKVRMSRKRKALKSEIEHASARAARVVMSRHPEGAIARNTRLPD